LPEPLYDTWFQRFAGSYANVQISYDGSGSQAGVDAITRSLAAFGATDVAMTDAELAAAGPVLHVPMALGAVAVVVNLPDTASVQLDGATVSAIFLGTVTKWNDPPIAALNPGVPLPDLPIAVVHRSDPSGSTNAFTAWLSASSPQWKSGPGTGSSVTWPTGSAAAGDDGVAAAVKASVGAIGYAASTFAAQAGLRTAKLRNQAGNFVRPTTLGIAAAGETSVAALTPDFREPPVVNAPGVNAYPIVLYADVLVRTEVPDHGTAQALVALFAWCLTTGQTDAAQAGYAALPGGVQLKALASLHAVTSGGTRVWP
jgi:phosphate transport system substrate-binding protein